LASWQHNTRRWPTRSSGHKHQLIIQRFGRYPHRNAVLGRLSTDEEQAFLREPASSF